MRNSIKLKIGKDTQMNSNIFAYLKHEQQLLEEMVSLAEKQQKALIKYDTKMLEEIASYQEVVAKSLRKAEEHRINLIMSWLSIPRQDAAGLKLSALERHFANEELQEIKSIRLTLKSLLNKLQGLNTMNRVLTNRARTSIGEMISHFTHGRNYMCNVKV